MNITKKPQIKKNSVLNTNPTSAETVVSAFPKLIKLNKNANPNKNVDEIFFNFIILSPLWVTKYIFIKLKTNVDWVN